jgi:hypothetical protein
MVLQGREQRLKVVWPLLVRLVELAVRQVPVVRRVLPAIHLQPVVPVVTVAVLPLLVVPQHLRKVERAALVPVVQEEMWPPVAAVVAVAAATLVVAVVRAVTRLAAVVVAVAGQAWQAARAFPEVAQQAEPAKRLARMAIVIEELLGRVVQVTQYPAPIPRAHRAK